MASAFNLRRVHLVIGLLPNVAHYHGSNLRMMVQRPRYWLWKIVVSQHFIQRYFYFQFTPHQLADVIPLDIKMYGSICVPDIQTRW
jgi:hypothetical protein